MEKPCKNRGKISYMLLGVVCNLLEVLKKTHHFGMDEDLFEAEIHMIKDIKDNEGIHVTGLAEKLNVTKGAVSQILKKLEKKGMIVKERDASNQSRLLLALTPRGEEAYELHARLHREFDDVIDSILQDASGENREFLKNFLVSLNMKLEEFL